MAITKNPPNTIWLGGRMVEVNEFAAEEAITPGMLIELHAASSKNRYRKHAATSLAGSTYAREQSMLNKGITDDYAISDLVEAMVAAPGCTVYAIVASGANIAFGGSLESAGNGKLKAYSSGVKIATAVEALDNSAGPGDARIRVEVV